MISITNCDDASSTITMTTPKDNNGHQKDVDQRWNDPFLGYTLLGRMRLS
jgi:hypothetical protein